MKSYRITRCKKIGPPTKFKRFVSTSTKQKIHLNNRVLSQKDNQFTPVLNPFFSPLFIFIPWLCGGINWLITKRGGNVSAMSCQRKKSHQHISFCPFSLSLSLFLFSPHSYYNWVVNKKSTFMLAAAYFYDNRSSFFLSLSPSLAHTHTHTHSLSLSLSLYFVPGNKKR